MNDTMQDDDAPINVVCTPSFIYLQDITEEYERLADILFVRISHLFYWYRKTPMTLASQLYFHYFPNFLQNTSKRGPNGESETVMIVKDYLLSEFDRKAKYVQRLDKTYNGDTKAEIVDMQQQLAQAISLKARKGEANDVKQLYYNIKSVHSKIKKIALDHDIVPDL